MTTVIEACPLVDSIRRSIGPSEMPDLTRDLERPRAARPKMLDLRLEHSAPIQPEQLDRSDNAHANLAP
ncbi:hypothetical protein [Sorangium cellulosum]|uniref:hypothetical protein n=1 Tax=Sorangium cellulosum TaxID=56 RepID=UPI001F5D381B|nr:hypothetical protein [Sorangium cellulosum]